RAFLDDAPIVVLDEATSALDSITEQQIQEAIFELIKDKTAIVIAHRLSTVLRMDRIIVMDKGQIIEQGNHQQLLALEGKYFAMWQHQSGGFLQENI
ncbi:MAG: ATP-binding cassette subfamily B protein, partial [Gammaproteobacteria bacterium]